MLINAEFLEPACLPLLAELSGEIVLILDSRSAPTALKRALSRHTTPRPATNDDPWVRELRKRRPADMTIRTASAPFPACPTDAYPYFLPACRRTIGVMPFAIVRETYETMRRRARGHTALVDPEDDCIERAAEFIRRTIAGITDIHEQLAMIRGLEHGFHESGWLLRVDPHRIRASDLPDHNTIRDRIGWYLEPRTAAIATLAASGMNASVISTLNTDQIYRYPGAWPVVRPNIYFGDAVYHIIECRPLEAYWLFELEHADHATTLGPMIRNRDGNRQTPKAIKTQLRRIAAETGLPLASHWTPPADQRATRWMRHTGITLIRL